MRIEGVSYLHDFWRFVGQLWVRFHTQTYITRYFCVLLVFVSEDLVPMVQIFVPIITKGHHCSVPKIQFSLVGIDVGVENSRTQKKI